MMRRLLSGALLGLASLVVASCGDDPVEVEHFVDANWASADIVDGAKMYDKWWSTEPTTDFDPIWASQSTNTRSGGDTWRCKECHGWDYIGNLGRYSSGSHFTGFDGIRASRGKDRALLFEAIKGAGLDHDMSGVLSDTDILNLTKFVVDGTIDMSLYLNQTTGLATGSAATGDPLYVANCAGCHGADGTMLDFKSGDPGVQGVGWLANDNPQETLHKIRWGHPGTAMTSQVENGLTDQQMGDILAYTQTLPAHFADANWASANIVDGAKLYDKWWPITGGTAPTTDFDPIWASQSTNTRSGGDTWRCKECHGWDYIGNLGRYSSGSHFTGFDGVWASRMTDRTVLFDAIRGEGLDHDMSSVFTEMEVLNLTKFVVDGLVDMSLYLNQATGVATGSAAAGDPLYVANCAGCHGTDGLTLDFDSGTAGVQGVGFLADDNPQETLHKIRWGHPGSAMTSQVENGLTDQQMGDILAYTQTLPNP